MLRTDRLPAKNRSIPPNMAATKAQSEGAVLSFKKTGAMKATHTGAENSRVMAHAAVVMTVEAVKHSDSRARAQADAQWPPPISLGFKPPGKRSHSVAAATSPLAEVMATGFQRTLFMSTPAELHRTAVASRYAIARPFVMTASP
jgi:hypothetical protein